MPIESDPEIVAIAQRILEERGYLIIGRRYREFSLGEILPHADRGDLPGPLVVVGFTDYREFRQQYRDYALPGMKIPDSRECVGFAKVVAE
ncbi:MAG TPA: hypothetical protein VEL77_15030 [Rugosimonospora sp.]|nr:hypothetical protein [Rugosimonospora sp.]